MKLMDRDADGGDPFVTQPFSACAASGNWRRRGSVRAAIVVLTLLVIGSVTVMCSGAVRHQLALSFTKQPVRFIELYFAKSDPPTTDLDRDLNLGAVIVDKSAVATSFTVANHEGATTEFPYVVDVLDETHTPLVHIEGSVTVGDGETQTTALSMDVLAPQRWTAVEVHLVGRDEHIRSLRDQ